MFIDSPDFAKRKIVNTSLKKESAFYDFGKVREQLIQHVYAELSGHSKDSEILEQFRKEAENIKKKKF